MLGAHGISMFQTHDDSGDEVVRVEIRQVSEGGRPKIFNQLKFPPAKYCRSLETHVTVVSSNAAHAILKSFSLSTVY